MRFKKGVMRKRWLKGKKDAKKACVNKGEENHVKLFSKDDFGPKLDDLEDLFPKKGEKAKEYKKAWEKAHTLCKKLRVKAMNTGISEISIDVQKALLTALEDILECLEGKDVKPA